MRITLVHPSVCLIPQPSPGAVLVARTTKRETYTFSTCSPHHHFYPHPNPHHPHSYTLRVKKKSSPVFYNMSLLSFKAAVHIPSPCYSLCTEFIIDPELDPVLYSGAAVTVLLVEYTHYLSCTDSELGYVYIAFWTNVGKAPGKHTIPVHRLSLPDGGKKERVLWSTYGRPISVYRKKLSMGQPSRVHYSIPWDPLKSCIY